MGVRILRREAVTWRERTLARKSPELSLWRFILLLVIGPRLGNAWLRVLPSFRHD